MRLRASCTRTSHRIFTGYSTTGSTRRGRAGEIDEQEANKRKAEIIARMKHEYLVLQEDRGEAFIKEGSTHWTYRIFSCLQLREIRWMSCMCAR
jgi:hypothetical protein